MKQSATFIYSFLVLVVVAALYRVIPGRPAGFAPQIAIALFGGAVLTNKKWAFALPMLSMFVSDLLFHSLYLGHLTKMQGFYEGQITNYILFAVITVFGFFIKKINIITVTSTAIVAPLFYFLASNGLYWLGGGINIANQQPLAKNIEGLYTAYLQGFPFLSGSILSTLLFSALLFGSYYWVADKYKWAKV
jgi:hypothetical protein